MGHSGWDENARGGRGEDARGRESPAADARGFELVSDAAAAVGDVAEAELAAAGGDFADLALVAVRIVLARLAPWSLDRRRRRRVSYWYAQYGGDAQERE